MSRLWIVEDNQRYRATLERLIRGAPELELSLSVGSCEEAFAASAQGQPPDLVLMDIGLPGMDGVEGTREIKKLWPTTPVVMLTIHEDSATVFDAICAGATGYLLKPSSGAEVLASIRAVRRGAAPINGYIAKKILNLLPGLEPPKQARRDYGLTPREREILQLLVDGLTLPQVAESLTISYHTANSHVRHIYEKLHVHSRSGAVSKALKERLL